MHKTVNYCRHNQKCSYPGSMSLLMIYIIIKHICLSFCYALFLRKLPVNHIAWKTCFLHLYSDKAELIYELFNKNERKLTLFHYFTFCYTAIYNSKFGYYGEHIKQIVPDIKDILTYKTDNDCRLRQTYTTCSTKNIISAS